MGSGDGDQSHQGREISHLREPARHTPVSAHWADYWADHWATKKPARTVLARRQSMSVAGALRCKWWQIAGLEFVQALSNVIAAQLDDFANIIGIDLQDALTFQDRKTAIYDPVGVLAQSIWRRQREVDAHHTRLEWLTDS